MRRIMITEEVKGAKEADYILDLKETVINKCCGCWSCWLKTPGRCVNKELDTFYYEYIHADEAIFLVRLKQGFVSSKVKALFERMCPLYLPYIAMGGSQPCMCQDIHIIPMRDFCM